MRQQIRLVVSPSQLAPIVSALESSPNQVPEVIAFTRYLKGKQFSVSQGLTSVAYTVKGNKASLGDSLGFDLPTINASIIDPSNVADYAKRIADGEEIANLNDTDKAEIKAFMNMMMMAIPANF